MIKGCQKKIIVVKDTGNDFFEEAYFILKSDYGSNEGSQSDIVKAATQIVNESFPDDEKRRFKKGFSISGKTICFMLGTALGALIAGLIGFLF